MFVTTIVLLRSFSQILTAVFEICLAHLSQRLIGELIGYPWSGVRCPQFQTSSPETIWPIKAKFYAEPPLEGGTKVYINGPGHMTKMATMPHI